MDYSILQLDLFTNYENEQENPDSSCGKMFVAHLVQIKDMILEQSSKKSQRPKFQCLKITNGQKPEWLNGGGTSSLAWRTLDAQYWGVPQRRKRIFLVADFGGKSAGEILFVEQGLPRDSAESERERESTPTNARESVDSATDLITERVNHSDNAPAVFTLDRASFNQGRNAQYQFKIGQDGIADTLVAKGPGGVAVIPSQQTDES